MDPHQRGHGSTNCINKDCNVPVKSEHVSIVAVIEPALRKAQEERGLNARIMKGHGLLQNENREEGNKFGKKASFTSVISVARMCECREGLTWSSRTHQLREAPTRTTHTL